MSENHEIVMQAKHIVKQFPASRGRTLTACNDINLTMYKGKTLGIVGESGCGKSTFVRMVTFLEKPTSGEILYHGKNITGLSKKETWENRQNLQMVFQDPMASFNPKMKIRDILTEPLMNYKKIKRNSPHGRTSGRVCRPLSAQHEWWTASEDQYRKSTFSGTGDPGL